MRIKKENRYPTESLKRTATKRACEDKKKRKKVSHHSNPANRGRRYANCGKLLVVMYREVSNDVSAKFVRKPVIKKAETRWLQGF